MDLHSKFLKENLVNIGKMSSDEKCMKMANQFHLATAPYQYSYHFTSLGRPIIQLPQDMIAMQELIWKIKPDLIIETGIAHGGSLIMYASMLALIDTCEAIDNNVSIEPSVSKRKVLGVDIEIREHNKKALDEHPMRSRIEMIEGSSIDPEIIRLVRRYAESYKRVLVCLDSNHTHEHVLQELKAYAPLVTKGSYCVVFDTIIEDLPDSMFPDRPWGVGNNPKTAVVEYLSLDNNFVIDSMLEGKLQITVAPSGYLKRVRD